MSATLDTCMDPDFQKLELKYIFFMFCNIEEGAQTGYKVGQPFDFLFSFRTVTVLNGTEKYGTFNRNHK